jgi:apolipoprotein N-acyltransferase
MSRLRAVETGRTVVQAATTGVSAIINADGDIVAQSGALFRPSLLSATVRPHRTLTLAVRLGDWPEWALSAVAVGALAVALARRRRAGRDRVAVDRPDAEVPAGKLPEPEASPSEFSDREVVAQVEAT